MEVTLHARTPFDETAPRLFSRFLDVITRREGLSAGARNDDDTDFRITVRLCNGRNNFIDKCQAQRVHVFRSVQCNCHNAIVDGVEQMLIRHGIFSWSFLGTASINTSTPTAPFSCTIRGLISTLLSVETAPAPKRESAAIARAAASISYGPLPRKPPRSFAAGVSCSMTRASRSLTGPRRMLAC